MRAPRVLLLRAARLAALLTPLVGCGRAEPRRNVILVSIDTLRADHLGCYGYERETSPHLDRLAAGSLVCANAIAPAPWTLPSHAGLLTGRHPFEMGVTDQKSKLPEDARTLAERLSEAGYQTAAWVDSAAGGFVGAQRGFDRGFDAYRHAPHAKGPYRYDMRATVDAALGWLGTRDPERPFFLFLHTKSVHTAPADRRLFAESDAPYHKPPEVRRRFLPGGEERFRWSDASGAVGVGWLKEMNRRLDAGELDPAAFPRDRLEELIGLYDAGIWYTDRELGRLVAELERLGLAQDTLLVVTADHGEAFLDNRSFLHREVYGAVLRVPLVVHDPGGPTGVLDEPVSLVDVAPTILERLGLPPGDLDGRPLPASDAAAAPRALFSSTAGGLSKASALQEDGWKLVLLRAGESWTSELYHADEDPLDQRPASDPAREARMLADLRAWLDEARAQAPGLELDAEAMDELEKLGYAGE